jgi:hypothetical protein
MHEEIKRDREGAAGLAAAANRLRIFEQENEIHRVREDAEAIIREEYLTMRRAERNERRRRIATAAMAASSVASLPTRTSPARASPVAALPTRTSPVAALPVAALPTRTSPVAALPVAALPAARASPVAALPVAALPTRTSPVAALPVAALPLARAPPAASPIAPPFLPPRLGFPVVSYCILSGCYNTNVHNSIYCEQHLKIKTGHELKYLKYKIKYLELKKLLQK